MVYHRKVVLEIYASEIHEEIKGEALIFFEEGGHLDQRVGGNQDMGSFDRIIGFQDIVPKSFS